MGFLDPVSGASFVLSSNGCPLPGYHASARGAAMLRQIADIAASLVP